MSIVKIDRCSWNRQEHFDFFRRMDLPFYNTNFNIDVSGVKDCAKPLGIPLHSVLMFLVMRAINSIDNLRLRLRGEDIVLHDYLNPSFTHLKDGNELFYLITSEYSSDLYEFAHLTKVAIEESTEYFNLNQLSGRDDLVFISPLPWISFTGIDHTLNLRKDDAIPRVTWGKCFESNDRILLPFNLQVNHIFVDGIHVARFIDRLNVEIGQFLFGCCKTTC